MSAKFFTLTVNFEVLKKIPLYCKLPQFVSIRPSGTFGYLGRRSSGTAPWDSCTNVFILKTTFSYYLSFRWANENTSGDV